MLRKIKILIAKILTLISPTLNTQVWFKMRFGRFIDMHNPQTLNEKICWLKLNTYQNNPLVTQCCDKYAVREYVTAQGLGNTLNELLGVWERPEDIDFDNKWTDFSKYWKIETLDGIKRIPVLKNLM